MYADFIRSPPHRDRKIISKRSPAQKYQTPKIDFINIDGIISYF